MPKIIQISPEKIEEVKELLKTLPLRKAAIKACVSYYAASCIRNDKPFMVPKNTPKVRKYESFDYSKVKVDFDNRCPITGFLIKYKRTN